MRCVGLGYCFNQSPQRVVSKSWPAESDHRRTPAGHDVVVDDVRTVRSSPVDPPIAARRHVLGGTIGPRLNVNTDGPSPFTDGVCGFCLFCSGHGFFARLHAASRSLDGRIRCLDLCGFLFHRHFASRYCGFPALDSCCEAVEAPLKRAQLSAHIVFFRLRVQYMRRSSSDQESSCPARRHRRKADRRSARHPVPGDLSAGLAGVAERRFGIRYSVFRFRCIGLLLAESQTAESRRDVLGFRRVVRDQRFLPLPASIIGGATGLSGTPGPDLLSIMMQFPIFGCT